MKTIISLEIANIKIDIIIAQSPLHFAFAHEEKQMFNNNMNINKIQK